MLLFPVLVAALLTISATAAHAGAFVLTLEDLTGPTTTVTINDGGSGDGVPAPDGIWFVGDVGGFFVSVTGDAFPPSGMNLLNFIVHSASGGQFRATLSRTD